MSDSEPVAPAVDSFDPVEWTKKIDALKKDLETERATNAKLEKGIAAADATANRLTGEIRKVISDRRILREENDDLRKTVAQSENIPRLNGLRKEVSALQSKLTEKEKAVQEALATARLGNQAVQEAKSKIVAAMNTIETMQRARDGAQQREAEAYKKLAIVDRDLAAATKDVQVLEKRAQELCDKLNTINQLHAGGHPEPVAGCKLCMALDRKPAQAAAAEKA